MKTERERLAEAYVKMAKEAKYRPAASGDGMGGIHLNAEEIASEYILREESFDYADGFISCEDDGGRFHIGISNYESNRALVYAVEACRMMCSGFAGDAIALKLLRMAQEELGRCLSLRKSARHE